MPNELRVRTNFIGGLVEDNPLLVGGTTLTSAALAAVPVISSTQHFPIVLDPDGIHGAPEIAYITAHTAAATTATILRAQEGTVAREHLRDTPWIHGPTRKDLPGVMRQGGSATDWQSPGTAVQPISGVPLIQCGRVQSGSINNGASETLTVTFPVAFAYPPLVLLTMSSPTGVGHWTLRTNSGITTTQVGIDLGNVSGGSAGTAQVSWLAIGESA